MRLVYADGACLGNPGPGGWAAVFPPDDEGADPRIVSGGEPHSTNQRMEIRAATEALRAIETPSTVLLRSDSEYVVKGMNEWRAGWFLRGWRNASKKPVANRD